jgi:hypothetical protein
MVVRRTGIIIAFLILLSPVTALPVAQVIGLKNVSTRITADESTLAYTNTLLHTYYGASNGTTVAQTAVSFPARVIGFMAPRGVCGLFSLPVPVKSGTLLTVEMTANNPVNFYLLSDYPSSGSGSCKVSSNPIVAVNNFTDFTLHWTAPEDGIFYFVFTGPTAVILLTDHGSVRPVEQSATITYPTSIETMLSTYSTTTTLSSTVTITTPLYLQATSQYGLLIIGVALLAITLTVFAFTRRTD